VLPPVAVPKVEAWSCHQQTGPQRKLGYGSPTTCPAESATVDGIRAATFYSALACADHRTSRGALWQLANPRDTQQELAGRAHQPLLVSRIRPAFNGGFVASLSRFFSDIFAQTLLQ
jgi:hypothetical protein